MTEICSVKRERSPLVAAALVVSKGTVEAVCVSKGDEWFLFREYADGTNEVMKHGAGDDVSVPLKRFNRERRGCGRLLRKLIEDGFRVVFEHHDGTTRKNGVEMEQVGAAMSLFVA